MGSGQKSDSVQKCIFYQAPEWIRDFCTIRSKVDAACRNGSRREVDGSFRSRIANGAYIGIGSFDGVGDAGDMLRLGSPIGLLWAFGIATAPLGLFLWHGLGRHFGLGQSRGQVDHRAAWGCFAFAIVRVAFCVWIGK